MAHIRGNAALDSAGKMTRNRALRKRVFERDQGVCHVCGRYDSKWQADHVLPLSLGGEDSLGNLETLCRLHHAEKTKAEAPVRAKTDRLRERADLTKRRREIR
jgi:5-methylcytosine-specific restriction endonuclease McrA